MGCLSERKKNDGESCGGTKFENVGEFGGFVLLDEPEWDKKQFLADFKSDWGIELADEGDPNNPDNDIAVFAKVGEFTVMVGFTPTRVPNGEAEHRAQANYCWEEAVEVAKAHKATLIVGVKGSNESLRDKAMLFVKVAATALNQKRATGFYDVGTVYEPKMYRKFTLDAHKYDEVPSMNLIWFGMFTYPDQAGICTMGMRRFGKEEMEALIPGSKTSEIRPAEVIGFLSDIAKYILEEDITLHNGQTIVLDSEKYPVKLSPALGISGNSFKIDYII